MSTDNISFSNPKDREKFSLYLRESGIWPQLVKILYDLYLVMMKPRADRKSPEADSKPADAIVYIQDKLGDIRPQMWEMEDALEDLNQARAEVEGLRQEVAELEQELSELARTEPKDPRCAKSELLIQPVVYEDFI